MSGATVNAPHGWQLGKPVASAEGVLYPTWVRDKPKKPKAKRRKKK